MRAFTGACEAQFPKLSLNENAIKNGGRPRSANGFIDMIVVGKAGNDPEMRYIPNGTAVTNFSLAINVREPRDGEWVVETIWVRVTCWSAWPRPPNRPA